MRAWWIILPLVGAGLASGCDGEDTATEGMWRLSSLQVDGEPFEIGAPLALDVTADGFDAVTTCNAVWGDDFDSEDLVSTAMLCDEAAMVVEEHMRRAFETRPTKRDDQLVFEHDDVKLVYERYEP